MNWNLVIENYEWVTERIDNIIDSFIRQTHDSHNLSEIYFNAVTKEVTITFTYNGYCRGDWSEWGKFTIPYDIFFEENFFVVIKWIDDYKDRLKKEEETQKQQRESLEKARAIEAEKAELRRLKEKYND